MLVPLYKYVAGGSWEVVPHSLLSPDPDGSVAYYMDNLSPAVAFGPDSGQPPFDDALGRAVCQYLVSSVLQRSLEVNDGPYIQVLPEDGLVPRDWTMIRAVVWSEEFDLVVPTDGLAVSVT